MPHLQIEHPKPTIYLGWDLGMLADKLREDYDVLDLANAYSKEVKVSNLNGILSGELTGGVINIAKFIDGAAIAFLAKEAGCIVTTLDGSAPPPLHTCEHYQRPGLIIASS